MKNLIVLFLLAFGLTSNSQTNVNIASSVERHAIVVPSDPQKFQTFAKENNYRISQNWEQLGWYLIDLPEGVSYQEAANKMKGVVKNVYPDTEQIYNRDYVPNDPLFPYAWYLKQSNDKDIDADEAWDLITDNGTYTTVAVFDGGLETAHEDMVGAWNTPFNAVNSTSSAAFVNQFDNHGTACSGTIAAVTNNGIGCSSVGNGKVQVMPINIMSNVYSGGSFNTSTVIQINAINAAMANPSCVAISMSYGGGSFNQALSDAFQLAKTTGRGGKGILVFASSGNSSSGTVTQYPASYSAVWGVGATTSSDLRASFSNYGNIVDISAPGAAIQTIDRLGSNGYNSTNYTSISGTSFSCPITAAAAALVAYKNWNLTAEEIMTILSQSAEKVGGYNYTANSAYPYSTRSVELGYGRINLKNAILMVTGGYTPPPPPTPKHNIVISATSVTPTSVNIGQSITINCTQATQNPTLSAVSSHLQYRYSTNTTWGDSDDIVIGTDTTDLGGGIASGIESITYTVPSAPGQKYILVKANHNGLVDETTTGDNFGTVSFTIVDPAAALLDGAISFTAPTTNPFTPASTAGSVSFQWKFTNTGSSVITSFSWNRGWLNCPTAFGCESGWTWTGNLLPGQSVYLPNGINSWVSTQLCFSSTNCAVPVGGSNTYRVRIITVNGSTTDNNLSNNVATCVISRPATNSDVVFVEVFDFNNLNTKSAKFENIDAAKLEKGLYIIHTHYEDGRIEYSKIGIE